MANLKIISSESESTGSVTSLFLGASISMEGCYTFSTQCKLVVVTPVTGAFAKLEYSNDGLFWSDEGTEVPITTSDTFVMEIRNPTCLFVRTNIRLATGSLVSINTYSVKGYI